MAHVVPTKVGRALSLNFQKLLDVHGVLRHVMLSTMSPKKLRQLFNADLLTMSSPGGADSESVL